eukprot:6181203-Pleurochrysis_carterae.AAC.1
MSPATAATTSMSSAPYVAIPASELTAATASATVVTVRLLPRKNAPSVVGGASSRPPPPSAHSAAHGVEPPRARTTSAARLPLPPALGPDVFPGSTPSGRSAAANAAPAAMACSASGACMRAPAGGADAAA